jgi:hypothetical protein
MIRYILLLFLACLRLCSAKNTFNEAISLFNEKQYEPALQLFEKVETTQTKPIGALMGQLFCHVALGQTDKIDITILAISKKIESLPYCQSLEKDHRKTLEEHQAAYACRRRVREMADQMRQTAEQLVRETVPGFIQKIKILRQIYPFIDSLEYTGIDCCQNTIPHSCCLNPFFEQLELWNSIGLQISSEEK